MQLKYQAIILLLASAAFVRPILANSLNPEPAKTPLAAQEAPIIEKGSEPKEQKKKPPPPDYDKLLKEVFQKNPNGRSL